jgi:hypothetical protein
MEAAMRVSSSLSLRIGGRGQRQRQLQQFDFAGDILRQLQRIEPRGFLRQIDGGVDEPFIGLGGQDSVSSVM